MGTCCPRQPMAESVMRISYARAPARVRPALIVVVLSLTVATSGVAHQTYPGQPAYPNQTTTPTYPSATYPTQSYTAPVYPGAYGTPGYPGGVSPIRSAFLATVAAVVGSSGAGILSELAQFVVGGILSWFRHKPHPPESNVAMQAAPAVAPAAGYGYPAAANPTAASPNPAIYGGNAYPGAPAAMAQAGVNPASTYPPGTYPPGTYPPGTYPGGTYSPGTYAGPPNPGVVAPAASPATGYPGAAVPAYPTTTAAPAGVAPAGAYPGGVSPAAPNPYQPGIPNSSPVTAGTTPASPPLSPYGAANPYGGTTSYGVTSPYGAPTAGATAPAPAYPAGTYFAANTGSAGTRDAGSAAAATGTASAPPTLYAGLAYEVHVLDANGGSNVVDPASYAFHSGDRFVVHFRPSLPGQMEVYNINASGKRTRIDSTLLAAGQLTTLGPYQFTGDSGDESLKFVLRACSTPDLLTRTRDIVKAEPNISSAAAIHLAPCGTTTRGIETRDIQKVALDQTTSFALDPLSPGEVASGQVAPREFMIRFHHQ